MNLIALASAFSSAAANTIAGAMGRRSHASSVLIVSTPTGLIIAFAVALATGSHLSAEGLFWGSLAGLLGGSALPLAYIAFARGPIGVVTAAISSTSVVVVSAAGIVSGAPIGPARIGGLILSVISIVLVTTSVPPRGVVQAHPVAGSLWLRLAKGPGIAVLVGVCFGGYGVALSHAPGSSHLGPLVVARCFVLAAAVVYWLSAMRARARVQPPIATTVSSVALGAVAGVLDSAGNILFVLSLAVSDLLAISLSTAMAPSIAALLSAVFLSERLRPVQLAGIVIGAVAVAIGSL